VIGVVRHMPSASSTRLSLSSAMQHQLSGDPAASAPFTLSTELTAPLFVPPQPVRAEQAVAIVIPSRDGPFALRGRAHNPVNIQPPPRFARSLFQITRRRITLDSANIYNTVLLVSCPSGSCFNS
jgi:hypothetical protein